MDTTLVKTFENADFGKVRVVEVDGEVWFVAKDVCDALDIANSREAITRLDDDELVSVKLTSGGQLREMTAVNEFGLYSLILGSRKPEAKKFKRWVTHEVLPAIRKTGEYKAPQLDQADQAPQVNGRNFFVCGIHGYFDNDGSAFFNLEDTARAVKQTVIKPLGRNNPYVLWHRVRKTLEKYGSIKPGQILTSKTFITEETFYSFVTHTRTRGAKEFQVVVESELIPFIRQNELYGGYGGRKTEHKSLEVADIRKSINDISKAIKDVSEILKALAVG